MPFTLSHAAVAIAAKPLRLPLAPFAIGAMSPDLPYFIGVRQFGDVTHSWIGVVLVVPLALLLSFLWRTAIRPAARDLSPAAVRARWQLTHHRRRPTVAACAAFIGVVSHIVLDSFTHPGRWGTELIPGLTTDIGPFPGYKWAQYGGGVLGLLLIGFVLWRWWMSDSGAPACAPARLRSPMTRWVLTGLPFGAGAAGALIALLTAEVPPFSAAHAFVVITTAMGWCVAGIGATTALWWALTSRGRGTSAQG